MVYPTTTLAELRAMLRKYRFTFKNELELQDGIQEVLTLNHVSHRREARLNDSDRPDFLVGDIVIEVKVGGALSEVIRQLHRYAHSPDVKGILLVSSKARHGGVPMFLNGKPVQVMSLMENAF